MREILIQQLKAHPCANVQDVIKMCYQATFGAEHLLSDREKAFSYFMQEWRMTPEQDKPITEKISEEYVRIHLGPWKKAGLPPEWLFQMFFLTASIPCQSTAEELNKRFEQVGILADADLLPFSKEEWARACCAYWEMGGGAVHHSEQYRIMEKPAYRLVHRRYTVLVPVLEKIAHIKTDGKQTVTIAIDGRAASGKTTLAEKLAEILQTDIIHMDDFFLPIELRTEERLAQPGGNVHYERFSAEVIPHLEDNAPFDYAVFNCQKMQLDGVRKIKGSAWRVIEGSYSHHPQFGHYMDVGIFCTVSPEEQMRRILIRNGERMAKMFETRWIPMEEQYFKAYRTSDCADMVIDTEKGDSK